MKVGARQIATSSLLLLIENIVRLGAVAAISFLIARQLGPSEFGILNFASALVAILMGIANMGLDAPVILHLSQIKRSDGIIGAALTLRATAGVVVFIFAVLLIYILKNNEPKAMLVTVIVSLSILLNTFNVLDYWFKSKTLPVLPSIARISGTLLAVCAKLGCLIMGFGIVALSWTVALEALITSCGLILAYLSATRSSVNKRWNVRRDAVTSLARESLPYMFSTVAIIAYMKIDIVMLGYLSNNSETGIYSLAQKLSEVLYIVPVVLIESAYPSLASRHLDSNKNEEKYGQMLFDLAVGGAILATVLALLLAAPLIRYIFGSDYENSVSVFYLHAWSCIAIAMNTARHRWLATIGLQRYAVSVTLMGLIINVALNFILIPQMGAEGAAIATVLSYFISGYISSFLFLPLREIGWIQTRALWPWYRFYLVAKIWNRK